MLSYAIYSHFIVKELYVEEYDTINWPACRNKVSSADMYAPHSKLANTLFSVLNVYEKFAPSFLRNRALDRTYHLIVMEDENTGYQTIGPVSKSMNMLSVSLFTKYSFLQSTQVSMACGGTRQ